MLAEGISEAMNCTAFGLIVALIALIGFALLNGKTQRLEDDINEATVQVLNLVVDESPEGQPRRRAAVTKTGGGLSPPVFSPSCMTETEGPPHGGPTARRAHESRGLPWRA